MQIYCRVVEEDLSVEVGALRATGAAILQCITIRKIMLCNILWDNRE